MTKRQVLSNFGQVLIHVAANPDATIRGISDAVCVSDRAITGILREMEEQKLIATEKRGRRSHYSIDYSEIMELEIGGCFNLRDLTIVLVDILRELEGDEGDDAMGPTPVR